MRDQYLPLIPGGTVITTTGTGAWLDLLTSTTVAKYNVAGVDQLGNQGGYAPLDAVIEVSGVGGTTPNLTLTLNQSDDQSTIVPLGSTPVIAGNGDYRIPFLPTKRYVRLDPVAVSGTGATFTVDAYVGTREF